MERKLATIEKITEIHSIPDADAIERAAIRGWNVVIRKGEFKEGDLCVYCEIDSVMPERKEFEFLAPRKYRIKTIKLKGVPSQGIIFPLEILKSAGEFQSVAGDSRWDTLLLVEDNKAIPIVPGEDVTDVLGVEKYDPPIPACLGGTAKGRFPSHSIKTDEERVQNLVDIYDEYKQYKWVVTEKLDGSSATFFIYENEFGIASRNLNLKEHPDNEKNSFWKFARENDVEEKMHKFMKDNNMKALTLQGELIGEGIQKNKYHLKGQTVKFFRVFDPIKYEFLPYLKSLKAIEKTGLEHVPVISDNFELPDNYEDLIRYANGRSMLRETAREGVVFVAKNAPIDRYQGRLSFKVLSNKYILKHDE